MKTTKTKTAEMNEEANVLSKRDMVLIKTTIALFGAVLNICCLQLFFY